jgi:hypothetical protein
MENQLYARELVKTYDIWTSDLDAFRIEILTTGNPKMPFSGNCYRKVETSIGSSQWQQFSDFPWLSAMDEKSAINEATRFLKARLCLQ